MTGTVAKIITAHTEFNSRVISFSSLHVAPFGDMPRFDRQSYPDGYTRPAIQHNVRNSIVAPTENWQMNAANAGVYGKDYRKITHTCAHGSGGKIDRPPDYP